MLQNKYLTINLKFLLLGYLLQEGKLQTSNTMFPNKPNNNDYGFNVNHKGNVQHFQILNNHRLHQNPAATNSQVNLHSVIPSQETLQFNTHAQVNRILVSRKKNFDIAKQQQIHIQTHSDHFQKIQKDSRKQQNPYPSITSSFNFQKKFNNQQSKHFYKQIKSAETIPSLAALVPKLATLHNSISGKQQHFNDFLYKIIGILSYHTRISQRFAFRKLQRYGNSVKRIQKMEKIFKIIDRNRLKMGFSKLVIFNSLQKNYLNFTIQSNSKLSEKNLYKQFQMEQSKVQKGLKYLEDRSQHRKKLEYQKAQQKRFTQNKIGNSKVATFYTNKNQQQIRKDNKVLQQQKQVLKQVIKPKTLKAQQNIYAIPNQHQKTQNRKQKVTILHKINSKQNLSKDQIRLQKQSIINKLASWVILNLNQQPLNSHNRKQLFQRFQGNQRKHNLNPIIFKDAEPDPADLNGLYNDEVDWHQQQTYDQNQNKYNDIAGDTYNHQNTLPLFDPTNNQRATRYWQPAKIAHQNFNHHNQNSVKQKRVIVNQYLINQAQFSPLPSFNRLSNKNNHISNFMGNQIRNQYHELPKKTLTRQNERSKSNSLKISQGDYSIEQKTQQQANKALYSNKIIHKIDQYYTDNNVLQRKHDREKFKETKASFDFSSQNNKRNIIVSPQMKASIRPKSLTYSVKSQNSFFQSPPHYNNEGTNLQRSLKTQIVQNRLKVHSQYRPHPSNSLLQSVDSQRVHLNKPVTRFSYQNIEQVNKIQQQNVVMNRQSNPQNSYYLPNTKIQFSQDPRAAYNYPNANQVIRQKDTVYQQNFTGQPKRENEHNKFYNQQANFQFYGLHSPKSFGQLGRRRQYDQTINTKANQKPNQYTNKHANQYSNQYSSPYSPQQANQYANPYMSIKHESGDKRSQQKLQNLNQIPSKKGIQLSSPKHSLKSYNSDSNLSNFYNAAAKAQLPTKIAANSKKYY